MLEKLQDEEGPLGCAAILAPAQGFGLYFVFAFVEQNELRESTKGRHLKLGAIIINWNDCFSHFSTDIQMAEENKQIPPTNVFDAATYLTEDCNLPTFMLLQKVFSQV